MEFGLIFDEDAPNSSSNFTTNDSSPNNEESLTAILVVGDRKSKPDETLDCSVLIDICESEVRQFLATQNKSKAIECLVKNFADEIVSELSIECQEKLKEYRYFGLKIGDSLLYPIQVPREFRAKSAIIEKLLEGTTKVSDLSCDQLKVVVSDLLEMVEYQRHTIEIYKSQLKAVKKNLAELTKDYDECQEKLLETKKRCGDPTSKIIDHAGTLAKTILEQSLAIKAKEAESLAKAKEVEKEILKSKLAKELMSEDYDLDKVINNFEKIVNVLVPLIEKIKK